VRDRLRYYARLAGLAGQRLYPHRLRATFATRLDQKEVNVTVIQELMGHSDINTTAHYVGVAGREMRAAIRALERAEDDGRSPSL
jgi:integrase/recombinase XerD